MKKVLRSKEMRALVFICVAMVMAIMLCVASIVRFNLFSAVVSIVMLATLSAGLGYQYCKHEDAIMAVVEKKPKSEDVGAKSIKEILGGMPEDKIIAKIAEKKAVAPEVKEVGLLEKYSKNN